MQRLPAFTASLCLAFVLVGGCNKSSSGRPTEVAKAASVEPGSHVFKNGRVYTVNEAQPWAEAVVVRGNEIVSVGDSAGADAFVGERRVSRRRNRPPNDTFGTRCPGCTLANRGSGGALEGSEGAGVAGRGR